MIISIHQPHFLPWLGYFNKALSSDVFVWLHSVQYRKNYFQNRTRITDGKGPLWLTLPVHKILVADSRWLERIKKTIEQCYSRTPYFDLCWPHLADALQASSESLDDINYQSFLALMRLLDERNVAVIRAEELMLKTDEPTERLVSICRQLGATHYIAGKGGRNYLSIELFESSGIEVIWQKCDPEESVYSQTGNGFIPGLSIIDCLFNIGPYRTKTLVQSAWNPDLSQTSTPVSMKR
jgi:hypothetical protein